MDDPLIQTPPSEQGESPELINQELYKRNIELARLYKEVDTLNKELERANEAQANLIHIMNHQIKGYLTKGRLVLSELISNPDYSTGFSDDGKKLAQQGFDFLTDGNEFIQGILHASSVEQGGMRYNKEPFDFKTLFEASIAKAMKSATAKHLTLSSVVVPGEYRYIGDERLLMEVLNNLLDNAIRYTEEGTINATLSLEHSVIVVCIKDTGIGITDEDKERLFTRGGRGKNSSKINVDSTGYGLYLAKSVVNAHHGTIVASSDGEGKGSTFILTLPLVTTVS